MMMIQDAPSNNRHDHRRQRMNELKPSSLNDHEGISFFQNRTFFCKDFFKISFKFFKIGFSDVFASFFEQRTCGTLTMMDGEYCLRGSADRRNRT
jgi:hypothetical protein